MQAPIKAVMLTGLLLLGGCSSMLNTGNTSEYGCPGMPAGVMCKTPREVYNMTNGSVDGDLPAGDSSGKPVGPDKSAKKGFWARLYDHFHHTPETISTLPGPSTHVYVRPVLEPATVLRIWVAPWIDDHGDLNYPSYIYTEVQPKHWSIGEMTTASMAGNGLIIPHKVMSSDAAMIPLSVNAVEQPSAATKTGGAAVPATPSGGPSTPPVDSQPSINLD